MTHVQLLTKLAQYDDRSHVAGRHHQADAAPARSQQAHPRPPRFVAALMHVSRTSLSAS